MSADPSGDLAHCVPAFVRVMSRIPTKVAGTDDAGVLTVESEAEQSGQRIIRNGVAELEG